jgi:hypothetical protein
MISSPLCALAGIPDDLCAVLSPISDFWQQKTATKKKNQVILSASQDQICG